MSRDKTIHVGVIDYIDIKNPKNSLHNQSALLLNLKEIGAILGPSVKILNHRIKKKKK